MGTDICTGLSGRPKSRWESEIKEDIRIMEINNWTKCMQNRVKGKGTVGRPRLANGGVVVPEED